MKIMLVEDDEGLSRGIPLALSKNGDHFLTCKTVREARTFLETEQIDMVLLDIGLPDGDGLSFCREIRKTYDMPILFLTANDMEYEEVAGLDAGADDYITKPFSLAVLRSRIDAAKRRMRKEDGAHKVKSSCVEMGPYRFDFENLKFFRDTKEIILSRTEQRLLHILVKNPNQILPREVLLEKIWGMDGDFLDENALSVTVGRLRNKLKDGEEGERHLKTVYGIGYVWRTKTWEK
ncbi:MAG: response regulator transcription factor [Lachnospiraceae bacterium]|nr:response regulator transcription factor [Lachnospiraceae bacterium]